MDHIREVAQFEERRLWRLQMRAERHRRKRLRALQEFDKKKRRERERAKAKEMVNARASAIRALRTKTKKVNLAARELSARILSQRHLAAFTVRMHKGYHAGWAHLDICRRLDKFSKDVAEGKSPRLMLQMPPRHGKSLLASIYFPAWHLGNHPHHEVIATSYSGALAMVFSRKVRGLLRDPQYQVLFPSTKLDADNQNAEGWMTSKGGGYVPAGVGGAITGRGAHILIVDDPIKNAEDASSVLVKDSIWEWYTSTAYTRLAPGGGVLIIQTRWAEDDLSGRLEALSESGDGDKFEIIRYPMIAVEDEVFRQAGEALHPERYPLEQARNIEKAVGPSVWQALYQQNPIPDTGSYFTKDMFRWYTGAAPERLAVYAAWDLAIGKGDRNDFTAGVVIGLDEEDSMWLLDVRHGRWDSYEIVDQMLDVQRVWHPEVHGLEKSQVSMAIGPYLEQRIYEEKQYEMVVRDLPPGRRDKELRARSIQGRMRQGRVQFPKDQPWTDKLYSELLKFPAGAHDDMVDALAWVGLMLQEMSTPIEPKEPEYAPDSWKAKVEKFVRNPSRRGSMAA
jgi:predicted phage terminase large subunit-like protein